MNSESFKICCRKCDTVGEACNQMQVHALNKYFLITTYLPVTVDVEK